MTSSMFDGTEHSQIFVALALIAGIIGSFSSSTVIFLIYKMKIWNLHIAMILAMTVFELLYDISFFSGMANTGSVGISVTSNVAQLQGAPGGVGTPRATSSGGNTPSSSKRDLFQVQPRPVTPTAPGYTLLSGEPLGFKRSAEYSLYCQTEPLPRQSCYDLYNQAPQHTTF